MREDTPFMKSLVAGLLIFAIFHGTVVFTVNAFGWYVSADMPAVGADQGTLQEAPSTLTPADVGTVLTEPTVELIDDAIIFANIVYTPCYDELLARELITTAEHAVSGLDEAIASGQYSEKACNEMRIERNRLIEVLSQAMTEQETVQAWREEYFYATETWLYFKRLGYSDAVACALIGNMMIETSGGTLGLKPTVYSSGKGFYGLCQWSLYYCPEVANQSFEWQLDYLVETMPKEFENFGFCYKRGFTFDDFLKVEDPATAAYIFAKVYERCGSGSYGLRKQAANMAFEYFTLNPKN
jgi:hypothetical protein